MNNKPKNSVHVIRKSTSKIFESHNRLVTTKMGHVEKILPKEICKILDTCGSCTKLTIDYKTQLIQKTALLKEKLKELGSSFTHVAVQHFVESEAKLAYRQSVKLVVAEHFVNGKPWIDIGFYRQSLNKIIDIGNCPIQNPILNDVMHYLRMALKTFSVPIYSPKKKSGVLSGLILRSSKSSKQTFVTFLVQEIKPILFRELACQLLEKIPHVQGVFLQLSDNSTEQVLLAGTGIIEEKFVLQNFKLSNEVELPIQPNMTSKVYARVIELCDLTNTQTVLHLYSGMGALSCLLAQNSRKVYALDEKLSYAKNIEMNLKLHGIKNVHVEIGKVAKSLTALSADKCDVAVVNAPRLGVGEEAIEKLVNYSPSHVVYVSSFHDQLFEDLQHFSKHNYIPVFIEPFDTHPGTSYFEVLCYLKKS